MLWVKAFHIIVVVCWFSGIFYLPRLFVNHAMAEDASTRERLHIMERKLYRFTTMFLFMTYGLGLWLISFNWTYYSQATWLYGKVILVLLLTFYHLLCGTYIPRLQQDPQFKSHVYFRVFNEIPVFILISIVILAVVKPFQ